MHHNFLSVPAIINLLILFFVFKTVISKFSKTKAQGQTPDKKQWQQPNKDKFEAIPDKQMQVNKPPVQKPLDAPKRLNTPTIIHTNRIDSTPTDKSKLVLKRCVNCGGEIPLQMMKCTICEARQPGLGFLLVFLYFMATAFVIVILSTVFGIPVQIYIDKAIEFITNL